MSTIESKHLEPPEGSLAWASVALALARSGRSGKAGEARQVSDLNEMLRDPDVAGSDLTQTAIRSGRSVLHQLEFADEALTHGNIGVARKALVHSLRLLSSILALQSNMTLADKIADAGKSLIGGDVELFYDQLPGIHRDLTELAVFDADAADYARDTLEQVEQHSRAGQIKQAARALYELADSLEDTIPYPPFEFAVSEVSAAQAALLDNPPDIGSAHEAVNISLDALTLRLDCVTFHDS